MRLLSPAGEMILYSRSPLGWALYKAMEKAQAAGRPELMDVIKDVVPPEEGQVIRSVYDEEPK